MTLSRTQLERYAKQSEVRVRSGVRLVGILGAVAIGAAAFEVWALAKLFGVFAVFFVVVTLAEYLNARSKRAKAASVEASK